MRRLLPFVLALVIAGAAVAAAPQKPEGPTSENDRRVPLRLSRGALLAAVKIGGENAGLFLLDTGSVTNVVDAAVAARLELPVLRPEASVHGGMGSAAGDVRRIESLDVGPLKLGAHGAMVVDLSPIQSVFGTRLGGVLGAPVWARHVVTLEAGRRRLTIHDRATFTPPEEDPVTLEVIDKRPYIHVAFDGRDAGLAMLDTGTTAPMILEPTWAAKNEDVLVGRKRGGSVTGVGGTRTLVTGRIRAVRLFGRTLRGVEANVALGPLPEGPPPPYVALVGTGLLSRFRVTLDYQAGKVWAKPAGRR